MLVGCLLSKFAYEVRIPASEQTPCQIMLCIHFLCVAKILAVAEPMEERGIDDVNMIQHELLDRGSSPRTRVPDLMKSLNEWEPSEGVALAVEH